ncbi:hypothetical protein PR048_026731 [Dryococelus australis]|uniref:Uncharacterized protein n=1 Tax=Dryococelus australis TaxID=614101 RepID=A0ABQ9GM89_9NEOP|nr:hypothetical protein PR048_026731 [Dryococelus australis]
MYNMVPMIPEDMQECIVAFRAIIPKTLQAVRCSLHVHLQMCRPIAVDGKHIELMLWKDLVISTLASHQGEPGSSPAGSPDFRKWELCRTMPLVCRFSQGYPISPAPSFRHHSIFASITLIGSQDLAVKEPPKYLHLLTHSIALIFKVPPREVERHVKGALRADKDVVMRVWNTDNARAGEKTRRPAASSGIITTYENLGAIPQGIEPILHRMQMACVAAEDEGGRMQQQGAKRVSWPCFEKQRLNRLQELVSGVPPPPTVTFPQFCVDTMATQLRELSFTPPKGILQNSCHYHRMSTARGAAGASRVCTRNSVSEEVAKQTRWPDSKHCSFHGIRWLELLLADLLAEIFCDPRVNLLVQIRWGLKQVLRDLRSDRQSALGLPSHVYHYDESKASGDKNTPHVREMRYRNCSILLRVELRGVSAERTDTLSPCSAPKRGEHWESGLAINSLCTWV